MERRENGAPAFSLRNILCFGRIWWLLDKINGVVDDDKHHWNVFDIIVIILLVKLRMELYIKAAHFLSMWVTFSYNTHAVCAEY